MNDEINYENNPLHGLSLENLLIEIVDHYGFEILFAYLNVNCFNTNPSIESSVKFLKKTDWAREKVEAFYMYEFKRLPRASSEQFSVPPRDRVVPDGQVPGEPAELSLEDADRLREKREKKAAAHGRDGGHRAKLTRGTGAQRARPSGSRDNRPSRKGEGESQGSSAATTERGSNAWANWKKKSDR